MGKKQQRVEGVVRSNRHVVRLSDEQESRLLLSAAAAGVTPARFLIESALERGPAVQTSRIEFPEAANMLMMLSRIGVNINQIAKVANSTGEVPAEIYPALELLTRSIQRLDALVARLRAQDALRP